MGPAVVMSRLKDEGDGFVLDSEALLPAAVLLCTGSLAAAWSAQLSL